MRYNICTVKPPNSGYSHYPKCSPLFRESYKIRICPRSQNIVRYLEVSPVHRFNSSMHCHSRSTLCPRRLNHFIDLNIYQLNPFVLRTLNRNYFEIRLVINIASYLRFAICMHNTSQPRPTTQRSIPQEQGFSAAIRWRTLIHKYRTTLHRVTMKSCNISRRLFL